MTKTLPALSLIEEFLLLALDDRNGQFYATTTGSFDCATAGAILMDLTLRGKADNDLRDMFVVDATPTGDDILDPPLQVMAMSPVLQPQPLTHWLRTFAAEAPAWREKALRRLETRGIVQRKNRAILWAFGPRRYPVVHDQETREVRTRLLEIILGSAVPVPHDIMLIALADSCGLFRHILGPEEIETRADRIAMVARLDLIGQAVAKGVSAIDAAVATAAAYR